nr:hypothetical protein [Bacteroidota bacterium]
MKINRNNFEAFFLDYWEQNLDRETRRQLEVFLVQNPDLQEMFYDYSPVRLQPDPETVFDNKSGLKRTPYQIDNPVRENNYETYIISELEGTISHTEKTLLDTYLKENPDALKTKALFQKTILIPDDSITFPFKNRLYRKGGIVRNIVWYSSSVAATILILIGLFSLLKEEQTINTNNQSVQTQQNIGKEELPVQGQKEDPFSHQPENQQEVNNQENAESQQNFTHEEIATVAQIPEAADTEKQDDPIVKTNITNNRELSTISLLVSRSGDHDLQIFYSQIPADIVRRSGRATNNDEMAILGQIDLASSIESGQKKKTMMGRLIAGFSRKIFGTGDNDPEAEPSLFENIAQRGKEKFNEIGSEIPVYSKQEGDTKRTYLALGENFNIVLKKNTATQSRQ